MTYLRDSTKMVRYVSNLDTSQFFASLGQEGHLDPLYAGRDLRHPGADRRWARVWAVLVMGR